MSITYDSEKWSNPRREWDIGPMQSRSNSGMLVSLKDLAYFKSLSQSKKKAIFPFIEDTENAAPVEPMRTFRKKLTHTKKSHPR